MNSGKVRSRRDGFHGQDGFLVRVRQAGGEGMKMLMVAVMALAMTASAGAEALRLRVQFMPENRFPVGTERYVALVREDAPLAEPAWETATTEDVIAWWIDAHAGRYRLICSAEGFLPVVTESFTVSATSDLVRRCSPGSGPRLSGRILARETNRPVPGAWIAPLDVVMPLETRRGSWRGLAEPWSELGEDHLRMIRKAGVDDQGRFALLAAAGSSHSLWVEAPGCAARFLKEVHIEAEDRDLGEILLEPGGDLELEVRMGAGIEASEWETRIFPTSAQDLDFPLEMLTRTLPEDGGVVWRSLPQGLYSVLLRRPGASERPPVLQVGLADVNPGGVGLLTAELARRSFRGKLTGIDGPLPERSAVSVSSVSELLPATTHVEEDGLYFAVEMHTPPPYFVQLATPDGCQRFSIVEGAEAARRGRVVEVPFAGAGVAVVVRDRQGGVVSGAEVFLEALDHERWGCTPRPGGGRDGGREFLHVPDGRYLVVARKVGEGAAVAGPLDLTEGETRLVELDLEPGWQVSGAIFDETGRPAKDALVAVGYPDLRTTMIQGHVGEDGSFHLADLPARPGTLLVAPHQRDLKRGFYAFSIASETTNVGVVPPFPPGGLMFQPGSLSSVEFGRAGLLGLDVNGVRLGGALALRGAMGMPPVHPGAPFALHRLPPGRARICWTRSGTESCSRPFAVQAGELHGVNVVVDPD